MAELVIIDGREVDPTEVLCQVIQLARNEQALEAFKLFKKLDLTNPSIPNFNYVKSRYLDSTSSSFLATEVLRRELEISPNHPEAQARLQELEEKMHRDPKQLAVAFPSARVFSIVIVASDNFRETHTAVRAALHQIYSYLEIVVVQRAPDLDGRRGLTEIDPRVRVVDAFGKSFWEAMEVGLQQATGDYQIVAPSCSTVFSDTGLLVLAAILERSSKIDFVACLRAYVDVHGFVESMQVECPKFSRASFLDESNLSRPTLRLDFTGVAWSAKLFRQVGNRLATNLRHAVDFELFMRFFREVSLVSMAIPLSMREKPVVRRSEVVSVGYSNEVRALIREEKRQRPLLENEPMTGPHLSPEDIAGPQALPKDQPAVFPVAPSSSVSRFLISNAPVISLVMPSYNQGQFLEQAIDSILSQGYPRLEFTIVDGGSTDESVEIIKRYEKYLTYWCSERDEGQYFAIQKGFDRSTGDVMAWLNSDDKLGNLALVYVGLIFLVFPHIRWISGRGGSTIKTTGEEVFAMKTTAFAREHYLSQGFDKPFIQQEGTFWRRSLWEEAGGALDLKYSLAAECELWHRFFRFSQLHSVDLPLGLFRVQREQRSQVLQAKYFREAWQISREEVELLHGGLYGQMLPAPDILTQEMVLSAAQERAAAWESQRL